MIRRQPSYQLSVKPGVDAGSLVVSAASKVPPAKPAQRIARVDVYLNGRPLRSIDAQDGAVPPTDVPLVGDVTKRTTAEAQAWDHTGILVALARTAVLAGR